jgi:hypothetical protein
MKIVFNPPQLAAARQTATLRRLAHELAPKDCSGELRVLHSYRDESLRLVLIQTGRWPASIELPRTWLYEENAEYELGERLAELFHMATKPVLAH